MRLHQPVPQERQPHLHQGGIPAGYDDGGPVDQAGVVDPNAYLQWPNQVDTAGTGFEDGGQVDPSGFLNPMDSGSNTQALAEHANQVYQDYHRQLEQEWTNANQARAPQTDFGNTDTTPDEGFAEGGDVEGVDPGTADYDYDSWMAAGSPADDRGHGPDTYKQPNHITFSDESQMSGKNGEQGGHWDKLPGDKNNYMFTSGPSNTKRYTPQDQQDYFQRNEPDSLLKLPDARVTGYAQGGGIPGPGPAGPGITPKPAKSPQQAVDRNFYQDQSSRQFTSPSVGTSFTQPGPRGGQRGQEWYGKKVKR